MTNVQVETTPPDGDGLSNVVRVAEPRSPGEQPCGAMRRPVRQLGWECDGTNLVVLFGPSETVPEVVIRRDLIPYLDDVMAGAIKPEDMRAFTGGDHAHITIPIPLRAPREVAP